MNNVSTYLLLPVSTLWLVVPTSTKNPNYNEADEKRRGLVPERHISATAAQRTAHQFFAECSSS